MRCCRGAAVRHPQPRDFGRGRGVRAGRAAPPPPGTFQAQVRNTLPNPVELSIVRAGERVGAAQPASLPALSETIVTFHIPIAGEWIYAVDGDDQISSDELIPFIGVCALRVVIDVGDSTFSCLRAP
jgi:hypothetical protein